MQTYGTNCFVFCVNLQPSIYLQSTCSLRWPSTTSYKYVSISSPNNVFICRQVYSKPVTSYDSHIFYNESFLSYKFDLTNTILVFLSLSYIYTSYTQENRSNYSNFRFYFKFELKFHRLTSRIVLLFYWLIITYWRAYVTLQHIAVWKNVRSTNSQNKQNPFFSKNYSDNLESNTLKHFYIWNTNSH